MGIFQWKSTECRCGSSFLLFPRSNWNLEKLMLFFCFVEGGKPECPVKNSTCMMTQEVRESNPGNIGGKRVLLPLCHPCSA